MNINIPTNDELYGLIKNLLVDLGLSTDEGTVLGGLLSLISDLNSNILEQLRKQVESYSTEGLNENSIDILYQIIGFPQEEVVNVLNVNLNLYSDTTIKDMITYLDISNGIEIVKNNYTVRINLDSINPIESLTEVEYNEVLNTNELNINVELEYEDDINIPEKTNIDVNGLTLVFDKGYDAETDYSRTTLFISLFLGSFYENLLNNNLNLRTFTPTKNMLIELLRYLSNVELFSIDYIDKPRGTNSFDIVLTPSKILIEDINLLDIRSLFESFVPEYVDFRIVKPVYYDLTIDVDLNVDSDFIDDTFTTLIENYFVNNYKNFVYSDFNAYVEKQDDIFSVNSLTIDLEIKNTNNSILSIGSLLQDLSLNEYQIFRTKNINITKAVV